MRATRRTWARHALRLGFALLSLLLVAFANVGTQGTGSYVNCMIVKSGMPKVSYRLMVLIAMVYVGALTVWGGVEEHFGAFISIAAFIQAPIIGMIVADYLLVRRRKLSLKAAYFMKGHDAYRYTGGFNLVGLACVVIACLTTILFVYNPLTGEIRSGLFLIFTAAASTRSSAGCCTGWRALRRSKSICCATATIWRSFNQTSEYHIQKMAADGRSAAIFTHIRTDLTNNSQIVFKGAGCARQ